MFQGSLKALVIGPLGLFGPNYSLPRDQRRMTLVCLAIVFAFSCQALLSVSTTTHFTKEDSLRQIANFHDQQDPLQIELKFDSVNLRESGLEALRDRQ
jgi:hypothetical protein